MPRKKQSRGNCVFCGREMTRGGLAKHFASCAERKEAVRKADQKPGKEQTIYHLQIQDAWSGDFWLHLEMCASETLAELDSYLRVIWLECCGHLSEFSFDRRGWGEEEIEMSTKAGSIFNPGVELLHIYDFGSSSETRIKVVSARQGKALTKNPIYLMARNEPPEVKCYKCGEPATWICLDCADEETGEPLLLCKKHLKPHEDADHFGLPFVNSPRTGICAYDGPAEPPY